MTLSSLLLLNGAAVALLMVAVWGVSLPLRNASIVDSVWGPAFALVAWTSLLQGGASPGVRHLVAAGAVTVWGLRLGWHISRRNLGKGEDPRYARWRQAGGAGWPLRSLVTVFLLQGVILWVVALPLQVGLAASGPGIGWMVGVGAGVWGIGFLLEATADLQLERFRRAPGNRGRVLDTGVWRYSRHPNYFGDAVVWWGLWLMSGAAVGAWWTAVGPLLMTALLRWVSGVTLLEKDLSRSRPGYDAYVRRTSPFLPLPPRRDPSG